MAHLAYHNMTVLINNTVYESHKDLIEKVVKEMGGDSAKVDELIHGEFIDINVIPNRLSLKIFGGELERDEYIGNNNNDELIIPPIIIVNNNPINKNTKNNSEYLKLFRKKKNKNTIIDSLE